MPQALADPPTRARTAPRSAGLYRRLPNALTILRLGLAGAFLVVLGPWRAAAAIPPGVPAAAGLPDLTLIIAASIFIVAALTDVLDGHLARRWGVVTAFGRVMDPFADKVLIVGAFIYLAGPGFSVTARPGEVPWQVSGVYPWMVVVVLARELLVTSIRAVLEGDGVVFPADTFGKVKMFVQSVCVPTVLFILALFDASAGTTPRYSIDVLAWATVIATGASAVPYILRARAAFDSAGAAGPAGPAGPDGAESDG